MYLLNTWDKAAVCRCLLPYMHLKDAGTAFELSDMANRKSQPLLTHWFGHPSLRGWYVCPGFYVHMEINQLWWKMHSQKCMWKVNQDCKVLLNKEIFVSKSFSTTIFINLRFFIAVFNSGV